MTQISIASALFACVFGVLTLFLPQISIQKSRLRLATNQGYIRTLVASAAGGLLACIFAAPAAMIYFGRLPLPQARPELLLPTAILTTPLIIFSIIAFDFEQLSKSRLTAAMMASVTSVLTGAIVTAIIFGPLYTISIVQNVTYWLTINNKNYTVLFMGGLVYGIPVGIVLGSIIGFATILTEQWQKRLDLRRM